MMAMELLFAIPQTGAKYLSQYYPVPMIAWSRYTIHLVLMVLLLAPGVGLGLVRTRALSLVWPSSFQADFTLRLAIVPKPAGCPETALE